MLRKHYQRKNLKKVRWEEEEEEREVNQYGYWEPVLGQKTRLQQMESMHTSKT